MAKPGLVTVAYPYGSINPDFHHCLLNLLAYDQNFGSKRLAHTGWLISRPGGGNVATARNEIVRAFLETDSEWLWFVDTDQTFDFTILEELIESAEMSGYRIVSALIMAEREKGKSLSPACVILDDHEPPRTVRPIVIPPVRHWECLPGAGCVLIHREVLETMHDQWGNTPWPWFAWSDWHRQDSDGNTIPDVMGEDYTFMLRATSLGYLPVVDTDIEAGHVKNVTLTVAHFWPQVPAEIIGERTYVIIPVKDQLELTRNLLKELARQGGYYEIIVLDNGSGKETRRYLERQTIATVIKMPDVGIHTMWNAGVARAAHWPKSNLCFLNNDLELGPNFLIGLSAELRSRDDLVAVSPNYDGRDIDKLVETTEICANRYDGTGGAPGFAFMVKSELFATGYRFPDECMWWFGDNDLHQYIRHGGGVWGITPEVTVEHVGGGGQTGDWDAYAKSTQYNIDRQAFIARWS